MNEDFLEITCPECKTILIVNKRTGKVVEVRKPILEDSTGDRFEDAFQKVKRSKSDLEKKFAEARERERTKMDRLDALFKEGLEQAKKEGPITKPKRDFDLD